MNNQDQKGNVLFKRLDLAFVYLFVFLVGVAIVLAMTSFLNNKVKEFAQESNAISIESK